MGMVIEINNCGEMITQQILAVNQRDFCQNQLSLLQTGANLV